jgi:hypothetical protein
VIFPLPMTFLTPAFLLTLAVIAPLAAIYFLKVRPRKKPVTAFFLWQKVFTEKKASALFKRLRDILSLLLMGAACAAVALALAEPQFGSDARQDLILVIDNSASMSANDGRGTRLEAAKEAARDILLGMNGSQRAAIASFSSTTRLLAQPTRQPKELLEAVQAIAPSVLPSQVEALRSLQPGDQWVENSRVILITDGCLDNPDRLPKVEVLRVGSPADNAGITGADLRPLPGAAARLGLFLRLASSYEKEVSTDVILTQRDTGQIVKVLPVKLTPGDNPPIVLTLEDAPSGRWEASLSLDDALAADNTAYLFVPERRPLPVGVKTDSPFFVQNAVQAFSRSDGLITLAEKEADARLIIALKMDPGAHDALVLQPEGQSPLWSELGDPLGAVVPVVKVRDHPLLRYLDAEALPFTGARKLNAPAGAEVLVADESGVPLIYVTRHEGVAVCVANFDPIEAQFYLSTWFPVLIYNAVSHLSHRTEAPPATVPVGEGIRVPGVADGGVMTVHREDQTPPVPQTQTGPLFGPIEATGFHRIEFEGGEWIAGASMVSPVESLINTAAVEAKLEPLSRGHAPSYWLIVLALGVLVGESVLYHRRKVG